jgi:hypothetical protein
MAVALSDIKYYLTGAASDGAAQADPALSLGNYRSSSLWALYTQINDGDGITAGDTTITVDDASSFAASGYVVIDKEAIQYTGKTGTTLTGCTRGALSTTATTHADNTPVEQLSTFFDDVAGSESSAGDTEYRCYCVKNTHATDTATTVKIYIGVDSGNGQDDISFAVEVPTGSLTTGNAQSVGNESTAPSVGSGNVSPWSDAVTYATGVGVNQGGHDANLDLSEIVFVWTRRTITAGAAAKANERIILMTDFDTV